MCLSEQHWYLGRYRDTATTDKYNNEETLTPKRHGLEHFFSLKETFTAPRLDSTAGSLLNGETLLY